MLAKYRPMMLDGKAACIVGAGGIGSEVGRLCAALGMRVVGIRRHQVPAQHCPLGSPKSRVQQTWIVSCRTAMSSPSAANGRQRRTACSTETFRRDEAGRILVNIARGEIVDEDALADALARDHLRGAVMDVYVGEFEHTPMDGSGLIPECCSRLISPAPAIRIGTAASFFFARICTPGSMVSRCGTLLIGIAVIRLLSEQSASASIS